MTPAQEQALCCLISDAAAVIGIMYGDNKTADSIRARKTAILGVLSVSGEAPAMEERVRRIKTKMAEDQYNVNAAPPKEPPAPTITYKDVNVAPAQEPLKGPSNEGKGLSGSNLSSSDKLPKVDIGERWVLKTDAEADRDFNAAAREWGAVWSNVHNPLGVRVAVADKLVAAYRNLVKIERGDTEGV